MQTTSRQPGAGFALPASPVSVGVLGRQLVAPFTSGFPAIHGREGHAPSLVDRIRHSLPVRRILAGTVQAGVSPRAFLAAIMAGVVHGLARLERALELAEPVAVSPGLFAAVESPVPLLVLAGEPRPAIIRSSHSHLDGVPLQRGRHV